MRRLLLICCLMTLLTLPLYASVNAQSPTDTPTATLTDTPTETSTPTVTDTPTATYTPTPNIYQVATITSGQAIEVAYSFTAGEVFISLQLMVLSSLVFLGLILFLVFMLRGR